MDERVVIVGQKVRCIWIGVIGSRQTWCGRVDSGVLFSSPDDTIPGGFAICPLCLARAEDFASEEVTTVKDMKTIKAIKE